MKKILFSLILLLATLAAGAQQLQGDPAVRKGQLDNGLTYYIVHNGLPAQRAEFYLATDVGAIQEDPGQEGLAHFLEHMCFNGTKNFPGKGILNYLQSIGASFGGNVNASTGSEETIYMLNNIPLKSEAVIDSCLLILHDYSHFVSCDPVEVDKERGVILEEYRTRNNASWRLNEKSLPLLYGDTKYATCNVIGSQENLETFPPERLVDFYRTWYRPDLQAVVVVGDVDVDAVEGKIKSTWSDVPKAENPRQKEQIRIPDNDEPVIGVLTDPEFSAVNIAFYWKVPIESEKQNNSAMKLVDQLMESIISNAMSERFDDLKAEPGSPLNDAAFYSRNLCETLDAVSLVVSGKEGRWEETAAIVLTEAERLRKYGLTAGEIERAKASILSSYEAAAANAETRKNAEMVSPLLANFFDNYEYMSPADKFKFVKGILPQLQMSMINDKAAKIITDRNLIAIYYGPEKEGLVNPTEEQFRELIGKVKSSEILPREEKSVAVNFIDPDSLAGSPVKTEKATVNGATELTLGNGATVVLMPTAYEKNRVSIHLFKKGGVSRIATEDLPSFETNIWQIFQMNQGLSSFTAAEVKKMLSGKEISISPYISQYYQGVNAASVTKDLETALQLVYLTFCEPRFDKNEFDQSINIIRPVLGTLDNQPQWQFQKEAVKTLFGNDPRHPLLTEELLDKASLETMARVYHSLFNDAGGVIVGMVGDFDVETVRPLVEKYIGSIPQGRNELEWEEVETVAKGRIVNDFKVRMETPKATVAQVYTLYAPFTAARDVAFDAVKYILDMVYTETLREEEGGTYGASVTVSLGNVPTNLDLLEIDFETNSESADKLRAMARQGLENLAANGPSADHFDKAVKNLQKKVPEDRVKNAYWLVGIEQWYKYNIDYIRDYESAIDALTPEDVKNVAASMLESGNYIELIMRPESTEITN